MWINQKRQRASDRFDTCPVAVIVGAATGIGAAMAKRLAREGFIVALLAPERELLEQVCHQINSELELQYAFPYLHDATHYDEIPVLFESILHNHGRIDALLYIAGVMPVVRADEYSFVKDKQMIDVNVLGAMSWIAQAASLFSHINAGQIVGVSSMAGERGRVQNPGYSTSKAALNVYLDSLRNRLTRKGVHVLTIKPGFVDTAIIKDVSRKFWVISPEQAAEDIYNAMQKRKQEIYTPRRWALVAFILRLIPSFIFRRLSI